MYVLDSVVTTEGLVEVIVNRCVQTTDDLVVDTDAGVDQDRPDPDLCLILGEFADFDCATGFVDGVADHEFLGFADVWGLDY